MNQRITKTSLVIFTKKEYYPFYRAFSSFEKSTKIMTCDEAFDWIHQDEADIAIIDCGFRINHGLNLLKEIKRVSPPTIVFVITEASTEETAIEAFHSGARYYLRKPVNSTELRDLIRNFLKLKRETHGKRIPYISPEKTAPELAGEIWSDKPVSLLYAVRYVEENLEDPIDLDILARQANLSKYYFCRLFKKHLGMTPMKFVRLMRVSRAKDLLHRKDLNITEVALSAGFKDHGSFIKAFRIVTGFTPREYRRLVNAG